MILNIKHTANWELIRQRKQNLINKTTWGKMLNASNMFITLATWSSSREELRTNMNNPTQGPILYYK
jgi:hypothetical protein